MAKEKVIVHITPDSKFVSQIEKFKYPGIKNKLVFWGENEILPGKYDQMAVYVLPHKEKIARVVAECEGADLVVINSLIPAIVLRLPKSTKIAWRFFGYEIYERILPKVLSQETVAIYSKQKQRRSVITCVKDTILYFFPMLSSFNRSLSRIDYFFGAFQEEYVLLETWGFKLPPFLQVPINVPNQSYVHYKKEPILILGNSRTFFNNHIDIIKILQKVELSEKIIIKLLFSYGSQSGYASIIRKEALKIPNIEFIEQFVAKSEFEKIYQQSAALIINSYRQMALGNIFIALRTGTKIYLSEKNITLQWLKKKEFKIFSVENDLDNDLINSNFFLSKTDAIYNFEKLIELANGYTVKDFQHEIIKILSG